MSTHSVTYFVLTVARTFSEGMTRNNPLCAIKSLVCRKLCLLTVEMWAKFRRLETFILKNLAWHVLESCNRDFFDTKITVFFSLHAFFVSNTFISNARLKLARNQANAKQHPEGTLLLFQNYSNSSSMFFIHHSSFIFKKQ